MAGLIMVSATWNVPIETIQLIEHTSREMIRTRCENFDLADSVKGVLRTLHRRRSWLGLTGIGFSGLIELEWGQTDLQYLIN